ncbi:hypothetical protein [Swingsia samuiensis]|uniref:Tail fiber protein n=1 Tax=Swingsia samuiensis TaxID=1293412 RepID=A0A4Y6UIH2_9PROT|nr:hypothetical protein [Swingsia samuiensis]QDH17393.1 hypothetical protein E3D00_07320 [Swingsia samuiensis]
MRQSDIPARIVVPFAQNASDNFKRNIPVTSTDDAAASWSIGFPSLTFTPTSAGGSPPDGRDFNGVLNATTALIRAHTAYGILPYDADFANAIGGYPNGATVFSNGTYWTSTRDNNSTTPGQSDAWVNLFAGFLSLNGGTLSGDLHIVDGRGVYTNYLLPQTPGMPIAVQGQLIQNNTPIASDRGNNVPTTYWVGARDDEVRADLQAKLDNEANIRSGADTALRDGINQANANANSRVSKSGDTMTGDLHIVPSNGLYTDHILPQTPNAPIAIQGQLNQNNTPLLSDNGNNVPTCWWVRALINQMLPMDQSKKMVFFQTGVIFDRAHVTFPSVFSSTPDIILVASIGDLDNDTSTYNWTASGCNVRTIDAPNGLNCSILAIGNK